MCGNKFKVAGISLSHLDQVPVANVEMLAGPLFGAGQSGVAEANSAFSPAFDAAYTAHLQRKLGLEGMDLGNGWAAVLRNRYTPNEGPVNLPPDGVFVLDLLRLMEDCGTDYTDTWRALSGVPALSVTQDGDDVSGLRTRSGGDSISSVGPNKMRAAGPDLDIGEDGQPECGGLMREDVEICDSKCLQPMSAILADAKVSGDQMRRWAQWIRQYMVRIDEKVSLFSRRLRQTERSTASWESRQAQANVASRTVASHCA